MTTRESAEVPLPALYEQDETAWLDRMAQLATEGRCADFDLPNLAEFLESMARRDRREVVSRLRTLLIHLLKWRCQLESRSGSWKRTIREQRKELALLVESGTLRNHALTVLAEAYSDARSLAADETGLPLEAFPEACPWSLDAVLQGELPE
jgi:hypothetical protein